MQTKLRGFLVSSRVYRENDLFVKFLSEKDELISGIVYGGLSKKKKNIYQIGFFLDVEVSIKPNKPFSLNGELSKPYVTKIVNDKYKLNCLLCVAALVSLSLIEGQRVKNIFKIVENFLFNMFNNSKWFIEFCIFLFQLLKIIGYEINISESKQNKYFDLDELSFKSILTESSLEFPHKLFDKNTRIEKESVNQIFNIFETVFVKQHLSNFNLQLPNQYHLFKKIIIEKLN